MLHNNTIMYASTLLLAVKCVEIYVTKYVQCKLGFVFICGIAD